MHAYIHTRTHRQAVREGQRERERESPEPRAQNSRLPVSISLALAIRNGIPLALTWVRGSHSPIRSSRKSNRASTLSAAGMACAREVRARSGEKKTVDHRAKTLHGERPATTGPVRPVLPWKEEIRGKLATYTVCNSSPEQASKSSATRCQTLSCTCARNKQGEGTSLGSRRPGRARDKTGRQKNNLKEQTVTRHDHPTPSTSVRVRSLPPPAEPTPRRPSPDPAKQDPKKTNETRKPTKTGRCKHPVVSCKQDLRHDGTTSRGEAGGGPCKQVRAHPQQEITTTTYLPQRRS